MRPAQQQRAGGREAGDVTDLGDEDRGQDRADALDREQVPVAGVVAQSTVQLDLGRGDLVSQDQHQPALGGQPGRVGAGQDQRVH